MPFEFTISKYISEIISEKYNRIINDDEIGYLSVIINLGIHKESIKKKRVLIVCPVGRVISLFLKSSYEKLFDQYLDKIDICSIKELDYIDLKNYDCIFLLCKLKS